MAEQNILARAPLVLVAESEPTARASLSELLRDEGYLVIETASSRAAVNQLGSNQNVRIILANLEMPSWSSIVKHASAHLPECFILGMVRYGALANAVEAQGLGAHGHFVKPLSFTEVNQWIRRCLGGKIPVTR